MKTRTSRADEIYEMNCRKVDPTPYTHYLWTARRMTWNDACDTALSTIWSSYSCTRRESGNLRTPPYIDDYAHAVIVMVTRGFEYFLMTADQFIYRIPASALGAYCLGSRRVPSRRGGEQSHSLVNVGGDGGILLRVFSSLRMHFFCRLKICFPETFEKTSEHKESNPQPAEGMNLANHPFGCRAHGEADLATSLASPSHG